MTDNKQPSLVFYGAGSMAEAIIRGMVASGVAPAASITAMNRQNAERLRELEAHYGIRIALTDEAKHMALREADVILLGMKPKDAATAMSALKPFIQPEQLLVSVIAGLSIGTMEQLLGRPQAIARTMPNTSSTIGLGASGICFSGTATDSQKQLTLEMFNAVGITAIVDEPLIEAVTAVSGSGPAYIYYMMESMIEAGIRLGLTPETARELTVQTVAGAAAMVQTTGEPPAELRRKVTSPGGSTQAALEVMAQRDFQIIVHDAMYRCAERAREMGEAIQSEAISNS